MYPKGIKTRINSYPQIKNSLTMESGIHHYKRALERQIELIRIHPEILEKNKKLVVEFKDYMLSEGIGDSKIARYMCDVKKFCLMLRKPLKQATEGDLRRVVGQIEQSELAPESKKGFKILVRKLYRFLRDCKKKGQYPPEVEWISIGMQANTRKLPEELLTEEEVQKLIRACDGARDKAFISTLAESGARISEIGTMKIKHVDFEKYGTRLTIAGKTGTRKILIIYSTPALQQWINNHQHNDNPDSFLWTNSNNELLGYDMMSAILRKAVRKAGIKKHVHPHLLRHSRATQMASIMSEAAMKQYFGWTQGSRMAAIYVHMSGKDTDEAVLRANGIEIKKEEKKTILKPEKCKRCGTINEITNKFCKICAFPLREEEAQKALIEDEKRTKVSEIMNSLLQDPEILELLSRKIKAKAEKPQSRKSQ